MHENDAAGPRLDAEAILQRRLEAIRAEYPFCGESAFADLIRAALATVRVELTQREATLLSEIEELGRTIAYTRSEIAALQVDDITASHIPSATDELDAIVAHTASATDGILEMCESLDSVAASLAEQTGSDLAQQAARLLTDATTRIYEACGFQDITGQRISKVVAALKAIDAKVAQIATRFGGPEVASDDVGAAFTVPEPPTAEDLLRGPQLPAAAMDQGDIDRLLETLNR